MINNESMIEIKLHYCMICIYTVKTCLSGHVRSREIFRIYDVPVFMKHDLFMFFLLNVEHVYVTRILCNKQSIIKILK